MNCIEVLWRNPIVLGSSSSSVFHISHRQNFREIGEFKGVFMENRGFNSLERRKILRKRGVVCGFLLPVDPWAPNIDSQSIASQLFAFSLFPYLGFLYYMSKSKSTPKLTFFGFYFLLAFVGATSEILSFFLMRFFCFVESFVYSENVGLSCLVKCGRVGTFYFLIFQTN